MADFTNDLVALIGEGELPIALVRLVNYLKGTAPDLLNEAVLHSARLSRVRREERQGLIDPLDARREIARITAAVLDFVGELPRRIPFHDMPAPTAPVVLRPPDDVRLERIFGVNHLKSIAWLAQGLAAAISVCRIVSASAVGSGFLITGGWLLTNNHVLGSAVQAQKAVAEFGFEEDADGNLAVPIRYRIDSSTFRTSEPFDVTVVRILEDATQPPVQQWGALALEPHRVPAIDEHVSIIQHPDSGPKMIALTANQVVNVFDYRLQYLTDTLPGSSGSPVFNDDWKVVAVHHAGGNLVINAAKDRRFANEGILAANVIEALRLDR